MSNYTTIGVVRAQMLQLIVQLRLHPLERELVSHTFTVRTTSPHGVFLLDVFNRSTPEMLMRSLGVGPVVLVNAGNRLSRKRN